MKGRLGILEEGFYYVIDNLSSEFFFYFFLRRFLVFYWGNCIGERGMIIFFRGYWIESTLILEDLKYYCSFLVKVRVYGG